MSTATELVPVSTNGHQRPPAVARRDNFAELLKKAEIVAKSGLFPGITSKEAAATLMLVCQAEGLDPVQAMRRYHIIKGRISMRADAMQAEFQARGGRVQEIESNDKVCELVFSHPQHCPEGRRVRRTLEYFINKGVALTWDASQKKNVLKDNWHNYPESMLWARCISAGVRKVDPGTIAGVYTPEEVQDFDATELVSLDATDDARDDRPILPALPPVIHNDSGYGRGQYASPAETEAFKAACREFCATRNARWLESWAREGIESPLITDLVNTSQLCGHLFKWSLRTKRLAPVGLTWDAETGKQVAKVSTEQRAKYLSVLHARDKTGDGKESDCRALWAEADEYCDGIAAKIARKIEGEIEGREPGSEG